MSGVFSFGLVMCTFFLERVIILHPKVILDPPLMHDPRLMRWGQLLSHHGGNKGGNYFMPMFEGVWRKTPQVVLVFPYLWIDFRYHPDMCILLGEILDH
jgi:hypothetical protein